MSQGYLQEIFSSFQGEGAAIAGSCYGLRQIFLRFAGCPRQLLHDYAYSSSFFMLITNMF